MAAITGAWLTPSEVHYLEGAAMVYVLSALVRYAVTYALVGPMPPTDTARGPASRFARDRRGATKSASLESTVAM
jgi:hypothetical protein